MTKYLTAKQINKKYAGKYINVTKSYNYQLMDWEYQVNKTYPVIHENTTLGEDLGTCREYTR